MNEVLTIQQGEYWKKDGEANGEIKDRKRKEILKTKKEKKKQKQYDKVVKGKDRKLIYKSERNKGSGSK